MEVLEIIQSHLKLRDLWSPVLEYNLYFLHISPNFSLSATNPQKLFCQTNLKLSLSFREKAVT